MEYNEASREFIMNILPGIIRHYGWRDTPAIREAWGMYIDSLCKNGQITMQQYNTWDTPHIVYRTMV